MLYASSATLTSCSGTFPTEKAVGGLSVTPTSGTCSCTCGAPTSTTCSLTMAGSGTFPDCQNTAPPVEVAVNNCRAVDSLISYKLAVTAPVAVCGSGSYAPLAPPVLSDQMRLCGGATEQPNLCSAGQSCLPKPPTAGGVQLCVYTEGVATCPSGYETTGAMVYRSVKDNRTCPGSCSCAATGGKCTTTILEYDMPVCVGSPIGSPRLLDSGMSGACISQLVSRTIQAFKPIGVSANPTPTCAGTSQAATGTAVGASPITVCCR